MPQPPKHRHLKAISGTQRPDRDEPENGVALPLVTDAAPPEWLPNSHAVNEWHRLAPILKANGLLTEGGLSAFGMLCAVHGKLVQLWSAGECPSGHLIAQYRNLCNDFGLTPIAQGKVKPMTATGSANPFERNKRK